MERIKKHISYFYQSMKNLWFEHFLEIYLFSLMSWGACFSQSWNWVSQEPESILETILWENIFKIELNDTFMANNTILSKTFDLVSPISREKGLTGNIFTDEACSHFFERRLLVVLRYYETWLGIYLYISRKWWMILILLSCFFPHPKFCDNLESYKNQG